jgi:hypothetical protein
MDRYAPSDAPKIDPEEDARAGKDPSVEQEAAVRSALQAAASRAPWL